MHVDKAFHLISGNAHLTPNPTRGGDDLGNLQLNDDELIGAKNVLKESLHLMNRGLAYVKVIEANILSAVFPLFLFTAHAFVVPICAPTFRR